MSIRKSVLFGLVLFDEILREFKDPGGFVSFSYKNMYGFLPEAYKRRNVYSMLRGLKQAGDVKSINRGEVQVTKKGKEYLVNSFPALKYMNKPWDGKWRIVGFDVEEKRRGLRDALRIKLYEHGFRLLQKSVYISPLPLEEEIEKILMKIRKELINTYIFISDKFFLEDQSAFLERLFHIETVNREYGLLLSDIKYDLNKEEREDIIRRFLRISEKDPFLPIKLLPRTFVREKVWEKMKEEKIFFA